MGMDTMDMAAATGSRAMSFEQKPAEAVQESDSRQSILGQWPVQLNLVSTSAPYFQNADLLIAADCVPFAYADFHKDFLAGKAVVIGCPKLDDNQFYTQKLTELFRNSPLKSITVMKMEVLLRRDNNGCQAGSCCFRQRDPYRGNCRYQEISGKRTKEDHFYLFT
jgi:hypothetical protein